MLDLLPSFVGDTLKWVLQSAFDREGRPYRDVFILSVLSARDSLGQG